MRRPGTLAMQRTWELHTKKLSRMFPGWLASMTTTFVVDLVLVQIQTSDDISSCWHSSFCRSCTQKKEKLSVDRTIFFFFFPHFRSSRDGKRKQACVYLELLIQLIQATLRSYFLFRALWSGHVTVKHAGSDDGASIPSFPSREIHTSGTPQLKTATAVKDNEICMWCNNCIPVMQHGSSAEMCNTAETRSFGLNVCGHNNYRMPTNWMTNLHRGILLIQWSEENRNR